MPKLTIEDAQLVARELFELYRPLLDSKFEVLTQDVRNTIRGEARTIANDYAETALRDIVRDAVLNRVSVEVKVNNG